MQLVNGTDTKKVYKGTPEQLAFQLALLEFDLGISYSHTIYTKEFIDSDSDIQVVYDLLEWLGFSTNWHEFIDGEGDIICAVPCNDSGSEPDIEGLKNIQKNICLYLCDKLAKKEINEKEYYAEADSLRRTVTYWEEHYKEYSVCA